jgi:hypothetical protein
MVERELRAGLCGKSFSQHGAGLTGSMLSAAVIAGLLTVIMSVIADDAVRKSAEPLAGPVWLWLMTTIGSWLVLAAGKVCERSRGERLKRRFGMLAVGLAFGAIAFVLSQHLMITFGEGSIPRGLVRNRWAEGMYSQSGMPELPAFLAYFGALFFTISWWKQSDPLRPSRLKIAPILLTVLAAWVWQLVWPFPQPWGFMLVAAISIVTQLSAPWMKPAERAARPLTITS